MGFWNAFKNELHKELSKEHGEDNLVVSLLAGSEEEKPKEKRLEDMTIEELQAEKLRQEIRNAKSAEARARMVSAPRIIGK